jgi:disulfide bond formation protein DsbB
MIIVTMPQSTKVVIKTNISNCSGRIADVSSALADGMSAIQTDLNRYQYHKNFIRGDSKTMGIRSWMFAALLVIVLILTACGGKEEPTPAPTLPPLPKGDAAKGKELFVQTCAACHGPQGEGVQGLGKDMTTSEFIAGLPDAELLAFINKGRDPGDPLNTTGVLMPPKGGNPALKDEQLLDIIAFIRSIQKR